MKSGRLGGVFIPEMGFFKIILKIKIQRGILPETPDPIKQTRFSWVLAVPGVSRVSGEEREYGPTSGKAPKAGGRPGRLVYWLLGRADCGVPAKGVREETLTRASRDSCLGSVPGIHAH